MPVEKDNTIKVDYTGTLEDGTVFDSSEKHGKPLEFKVGSGMVIKGFDDAVLGMEVNEEKEFKIECKDAYGDHNPKLKQEMEKSKLPEQAQNVQVGQVLAAQTQTGQQIPALVCDVTDTHVTMDLNHPLAGKDLNFKIKIVEIN